MRTIIKGLLALPTGLALAGVAHAEIPIGVAGPMSGTFDVFGEQMRAGAEQAVEDINAAGGVLGETLVLEIGDDACDPEQARAVANQMAGRDIAMMAGHLCSISSIEASDVYSDAAIIQISPASTNPRFTDERPGPGIMRVIGRDDQQGMIAGAFLAENFADKKIAIVHDNTAYGKALADDTRKSLNQADVNEVLYDTYAPGEDDYSSLVSKLKAANIDVVYVGGYHTEAGLIKLQMVDQAMDTVLVSGDALMTREYWSITGDAGNGTLMTFTPDPRKNPMAAPVVERLEKTGRTTEGFSLFTYAAIQAWAQAAGRAGTLDHDPVVAELANGSFDTVLGALDFDDKGDVTLPGFVVYEWKNGDYDYH